MRFVQVSVLFKWITGKWGRKRKYTSLIVVSFKYRNWVQEHTFNFRKREHQLSLELTHLFVTVRFFCFRSTCGLRGGGNEKNQRKKSEKSIKIRMFTEKLDMGRKNQLKNRWGNPTGKCPWSSFAWISIRNFWRYHATGGWRTKLSVVH